MVNRGYDYLLLTLSTTAIHLGKRLNLFRENSEEKNLVNCLMRYEVEPCNFIHIPHSKLNKPYCAGRTEFSSEHLRDFVCRRCLARRKLMICHDNHAPEMIDPLEVNGPEREYPSGKALGVELPQDPSLIPTIKPFVDNSSVSNFSFEDTLYGTISYVPRGPGGSGDGGDEDWHWGSRMPREPWGK
jgi:hypothetical protein